MQSSLLRATLTLLAGGALAQALPLLLGPWLTRLYTPAEYGQFSFVWTVATNLAVVGCARFEFALPMETDDHAAATLLALCARVLLAVTVVALVVAQVLAWAQGLPLVALIPLAVLTGALTQALTLWSTRAERFHQLAASRVLQYGGGAVLQVAFGMMAFGAFGLFWGALLAGVAATLLLARPAPQGGWRGLWRTPRTELTAMARKHRDFPIFNTPHAFAGALQDSLSMALIAWWAGDAQVGYWALAFRYLKAPAGLVGGALSQALYPRLAQAGDMDAGRRVVRHAMAVLGSIALALMVILMLIGPWLFRLIFGQSWAQAGELARALAPYIAMHFVASPLSVAPMAWRAQGWMLKLALIGQAMFVIGLVAGLQMGGLLGAAWGVSGMMLAYFGYFFWKLATWK